VIALWIAIAGGLGCVCRYGVTLGLRRVAGTSYPWGTFAANILGAFVMGVIVAYVVVAESRSRIAITTGFLGGFTTYSAFALETVDFLENRQVGLAATYIVTTLVVAGLACAAGLHLGRALR
jgi:CrcB protein